MKLKKEIKTAICFKNFFLSFFDEKEQNLIEKAQKGITKEK